MKNWGESYSMLRRKPCRLRAMTKRTLKRIVLLLGLMMPVAGAIGCGGGHGGGAKSANITPGEMPEGASWKGVYYSTLYGFLHIKDDGDGLKGAWRTVAGDAWGEMSGKSDGNIFRFEWTEHRIGMVGPSAVRSGRGYFRYVKTATEEVKSADEIQGEWGLGDSETGNAWKATKQTNMEPDLKSVKPDEVESAGSSPVGGWDSGPGAAKDQDEDSGKGKKTSKDDE